MQKKSLYIHIPFCLSKCLFCSFVVSVGQMHKMDSYINALEVESKKYRGEAINTVYWGGGTPALLNQYQIERLVLLIRKNFVVDADAEWTIEANPENLDLDKARFLKSIGFNRLSIGVQSFDDIRLKFLGRNHDSATAIQAYESSRQAGFNNINLDLMFSFPGQTMDELSLDLAKLKKLRSDHVSLYGLTIDENSRFYAKQLKLDDQELQAQQYVFICEELDQSGLQQYEVSNFCRAGFASIHNSGYWNANQYIGLGVGAHSFVGNRRFWNVTKLTEYFKRIEVDHNAIDGFDDLSAETLLMERVIFGLRKNEGINIEEVQSNAGLMLSQDRWNMLRGFVEAGFLICEQGRFKTTLKGRLVLDELACRLI